MKKISYKYLLVLLSGVLVFVSCQKVLDPEPEMVLSDQIALTTTVGIQSAVIGCYHKMQSGDLYGGNVWAGGEMLANNVKKSGEGNIVFEETQLLEKNMSDENRIVTSLWSNSFSLIHSVNSIIKAVPEVTDPDIEKEKDRLIGEAKFIRGMMYFDMIRYYGNPNDGNGVPLLTEPLTIFDQPARATTEAVYQQVIADLTDAANLLPENNNDRATKWAAKAILSRVYFYKKEYQNAADIATEVINSGKFALVDSMPLNYAEGSPSEEVIFAMMSTLTDASCGTLNGYFRQAQGAKFSPSNTLAKIFLFSGGMDDKRYTQLFKIVSDKLFCAKFDQRYMNVPIIRLAELYLTRGESIFNGATVSGITALGDINIIRLRAGLTPLETLNSTSIYYERTKELALEGDNFFNQKRLEKDKISDYELPWNNRKLLYLIPKSELEVNPNLVQN
ncbi:MAG: RagB/SusD family nutrient uptake outer membrane protein [Bacteroidales bacterium]|nr:RagB/SusD family nutrient uptake outer membrane protein [Bacteroidales bacterium]